MYYGPAENCQVANYQEALKQFLVFLDREKWTKEEKGNLSKGVKQQFQEMILTRSLDLVRYLVFALTALTCLLILCSIGLVENNL